MSHWYDILDTSTYFISARAYSRLINLYQVILEIVDSLPANSKIGNRPVRGRPECNLFIFGQVVISVFHIWFPSNTLKISIYRQSPWAVQTSIFERRLFCSEKRKQLLFRHPKNIRKKTKKNPWYTKKLKSILIRGCVLFSRVEGTIFWFQQPDFFVLKLDL